MLRQTDILTTVATLIKNNFNLKVFKDEIQEGFKPPCFFIKLIRRADNQSTSVNSNNLSIIITYFTNTPNNKEIDFLNMIDDMYALFNVGFQVEDRFLKITTFSNERIGEKQDILQFTLSISYLDDANVPEVSYPLMGGLKLTEIYN